MGYGLQCVSARHNSSSNNKILSAKLQNYFKTKYKNSNIFVFLCKKVSEYEIFLLILHL